MLFARRSLQPVRWRTKARFLSSEPPQQPTEVVYGKNKLGLGPNATGLLLGFIFFGAYFGSSWYTKRWIMANADGPLEPPKNFKDIRIVKSEPER